MCRGFATFLRTKVMGSLVPYRLCLSPSYTYPTPFNGHFLCKPEPVAPLTLSSHPYPKHLHRTHQNFLYTHGITQPRALTPSYRVLKQKLKFLWTGCPSCQSTNKALRAWTIRKQPRKNCYKYNNNRQAYLMNCKIFCISVKVQCAIQTSRVSSSPWPSRPPKP